MNHVATRAAQAADLDTRSAEGLAGRLIAKYADRVAGYFHLAATPARFAPFPPDLADGLRDALRQRGIDQLYSHQREACDAIAAGRHVVIVTPTASGKSLCYHLPVVDAALKARKKSLMLSGMCFMSSSACLLAQ